MRRLIKLSSLIILLLIVFYSCNKETFTPQYLTENVIVVVIDGVRYSETWGDSSHQYIPNFANQLSNSGVILTQFFNNGPTYTLSGHTSITTGFYQEMNNTGNEIPLNPSFFQYWNRAHFNNSNLAWIITSKDKLEIISNCQLEEWNDKFEPSVNCGINGLGSGHRHDSITFDTLIQVLSDYHPKIVLVNFREPDYSAHTGNWTNYLNGIKSSDEYAFQIWNFIQSNSYYKGKTTLFITNDHGRHLDTIADGFVSHGDDCIGCKHINFYAFGPDFKQGVIIETKRELIDISTTIAELLHFRMEYSNGEIMSELFK